ncbi:MAG: 5-formyltetrahydrofolate cyclo-ligase [Psychrobium sp.]|nr:5-formyltetrahydrofolate cyclo-ligase [Psychrobium sp.]
MTTNSQLLKRNDIRQLIREKRQLLTEVQQHSASVALLQQVLNNLPTPLKRVAIYLSNDGEINPNLIIEALWQQNVEVYLPVLHPFCDGHLLFLRYEKSSMMVANKYGISEPKLDVSLICPLAQLDVIFTPLVAFDAQGNRMGMGGGYYDRTLARNSHLLTIGLAHDLQQLPCIPSESWDIPLKKIITPSQVIANGNAT